jgi:hypothetical protein
MSDRLMVKDGFQPWPTRLLALQVCEEGKRGKIGTARVRVTGSSVRGFRELRGLAEGGSPPPLLAQKPP